MKNKVSIILFLFISLTACNDKNDKIAILKVLEDQRQAWNKGNLESFMNGYIKSDSLLFVGRDGPKYGWKTTLDNYKRGYPDKAAMGFLTFNIKEVKLISTDHAFVLGGWHLKREKDEPQGAFTLLLKKVNGEWKIVVDHSS
jgi:ketosteroid isomerase-like protein